MQINILYLLCAAKNGFDKTEYKPCVDPELA
jgi:hypothetical protein